MGDPKTVLEGTVKYRDRKKWKARWAVVSKLSPVADCLNLQLYRDSKERCKNGPTKASLSLQGFLGMETGFTLDKESNTMALICSELVVVLAFDSRELLIQWQVKIRANLAEEQQYLVQIATVPPKSKLPCGPARLHLQDHIFSLIAGVPPRLLGTWPIKELRRFGVIEGKFCFEGGSLCGKGEGLHVLLTNQSEELSQAMTLASKGKLPGKRKTLSRKNSLLETSTRSPMSKSSRRSTDKCNTSDSSRPLISSGSECSTCDACSEILRCTDTLAGSDDMTYNSTKASSCRIHYRWPSCMSRWGHSSTITTSDVESMDTVSVTLSDYHGTAHSSNSKKPSDQGSSSICLCDGQGTWPFNHCTKCGRQFYSSSSLSHQSADVRSSQLSPTPHASDCANSFSPQWTMNAALPSPTNGDIGLNQKKDPTYQAMQPLSDRTSLCSHTSRSSSASTASSSGSEYSVPRNYLETLYDKPKSLVHVRESSSKVKNGSINSLTTSQLPLTTIGNPGREISENIVVCPCHEPINEWSNSDEDNVRPQCSCWNQLSLSMRNDQEFCMTVSSNQKCKSTKSSPSSSPKKVPINNGTNSMRTNVVSAMPVTKACTCTKNNSIQNPNAHYAVPRSAIANLYMKDIAGRKIITKRIVENPLPTVASEDYDVPKKFADILASSEMSLKSSLKALDESNVCKCGNTRVSPTRTPVKENQQTEIIRQHYERSTAETLQICTCQRVMLWAGSFVPCLGVSSKKPTEPGWQCSKLIGYSNNSSRAIPNHYGTICCEPPRMAEIILQDGKPKHILHPQIPAEIQPNKDFVLKGNEETVLAKSSSECSSKDKTTNTDALSPMLEVSEDLLDTSNMKDGRLCDSTNANYENLEFAQSLPLYENSSTVLCRLDSCNTDCNADKPPLPPRIRALSVDSSTVTNSETDDVTSQLCPCKRVCSHVKHAKSTNEERINAYELMSFEKQNGSTSDEDYLLMQPVYPGKSEENEPQDKLAQVESFSTIKSRSLSEKGETGELPLRPFMPFSYPHLDSNEIENHAVMKGYALPQSGTKSSFSDVMSRRCQLINEDADLRSTRSNSLSELKKIVLLRKRSSSVDGKSSVPVSDYRIQSNPGSPINSARSLSHRNVQKNSLFAKLSLRSKEKSMSTNEILPQIDLPSVTSILSNDRRSNLHRSADCLKLNEEYTNSDDDVSNDHSEASIKETATMKRSCSVPCPSSLPGNLPSSPTNNVPVIPELNDLNKETSGAISSERLEGWCRQNTDSHEKLRASYQCAQSICDKSSHTLHEERYIVKGNAQVSPRKISHQNHSVPVDSLSVLDPYKSSSSSSSSDISDFIESLSHCSRSSSSSSGSSSEYMRSEDIYSHKYGAKAASAKSTSQKLPSTQMHKSPNVCCGTQDSDGECRYHSYASRNSCLKHISESCKNSRSTETPFRDGSFASYRSSQERTSSSETFEPDDGKVLNENSCVPTTSSVPVTIPSSSCHCSLNSKFVNGSGVTRDSRSSSSSSSSFSSSSSTTDYISSSSGNGSLPATVILNISEEDELNEKKLQGAKASGTSRMNVMASESTREHFRESANNDVTRSYPPRSENSYM